MERLDEVKLSKVHILSILDCYYKILPMIYIGFNSEGITIQGSCEDQRNWLLHLFREILLGAMNVESLQL